MAWIRSTGLKNAMNVNVGIAEAFTNGTLVVYGGVAKPTDADAALSGSAVVLHQFTNNGGAFTPGVATNGINFGVSTSGVLAAAVGEVWKSTSPADGTATFAIFYANDMTTGASTTARRAILSVGTTTAFDLKLKSTTIATGDVVTITSVAATGP